MHFLILSIICSVSVGIIFKSARRFNICLTQIVGWNYVFALILCYLFFSPELETVDASSPWGIYIPLMVLLPSIFVILAASIKHIGIVKTDAAQRLSLFIPILAAWFIFKEDFSMLKVIGLCVGFPAILLILAKREEDPSETKNWLYPAFVLVGFGVIDVLFKQVALYSTLPYTTSLFIVFCGALALTVLAVLRDIFIKGYGLNFINLPFGALVGIFNFGNILFYLEAHKAFSENPSTVFASMNMGVIVLGSLVGIFIFKEKLSKRNYLGIAMALAAIVLITLSQIYT